MANAPSQKTWVLLIEDNPGDAGIVREFLLENPADGFRVKWAKTLAEADQIAQEQSFDVVLTDLSLPDSQGLETIRAVVQRFATQPIVVSTGLADSSMGVRAVQEGCQDYLVKGSGDAETLRRTLRYAIERKAITLSLKESEEKFRALVDATPDAILVIGGNRILLANPSAERLFGHHTLPLVGLQTGEIFSFAGEDWHRALTNALDHHQSPAEPVAWRWPVEKEGWRYLETNFIPITLSGAAAVQVVTRDVSARVEAEREQRLAATLFQTTDEAMMVTDGSNRIVTVNRAFERITGYSVADVLGQDPKLLGSGRHSAEFYREMWERLIREGHWHGELWNRRKDGQIYVQRLTISILRDPHGAVVNHVSVFSDVTDEKMEADRLRHHASHDPLTNLPNRLLFTDRLEQALSKARRESTGAAIFYIDLDGFKPVNDTLGHLAGDLLLQGVAQRLLNCVRECDTVARLGGDEFVVLTLDVASHADAQHIADKLAQSLEPPFPLEGQEVRVGGSVGIALFPDDGRSSEILLAIADQQMYATKKLRKERAAANAGTSNSA